MTLIRCYLLNSGDSFYIKSDEHVQLGDQYKKNFTVEKIDYESKKWWQFWKPKKQLGFVVRVK